MTLPASYSRHPEGKLLRRLQDEPLSPACLLSGEERFFVRRGIQILRQKIVTSPELEPFLCHILYGAEVRGEEFLDLAETMPFFDRNQLVLIYDAEKLSEPARKRIQDYFERPAPFTTVVLVAAEKVPKGSLFSSVVGKWPRACLHFGRLKKRERLDWLRELAREKGLGRHLSEGVIDQLVGDLQVPLEILANRLEILSLYDTGKEAASIEEALSHMLPEIPDQQGYLLADAVLRGDEATALELLQRFLNQGTAPLLLLGRLVWQVRTVWRIKEALEAAESLEPLLNSTPLRINRDRYVTVEKKTPWSALKAVVFSLEEKERRLKSSKLDAGWHLEELCGELAQKLRSEGGL